MAGRRKWFPRASHVLEFWDAVVKEEHLEAGRVWYKEAQRQALAMSQAYGVDFPVVCAVISIYSINTPWEVNLKMARRTLEKWANGDRAPGYGLKTVKKQVNAVLQNNDPTHIRGQKLSDFYRAILTGGKHGEPVIDRHMARISLGIPDWDGSVTPAVYREAQRVYKEALDLIHAVDGEYIEPAPFQAAAWIAFRPFEYTLNGA